MEIFKGSKICHASDSDIWIDVIFFWKFYSTWNETTYSHVQM